LNDLLPSSQSEGCDFTGAIWKSAMEDLPSISKGNSKLIYEWCDRFTWGDCDMTWLSTLVCCSVGSQEVFSVARLTKEASHKRLVLGKVPFLLAMLKSVAPQGNGACVILKDPSGMLYREVHV